ncbi:hypothetical protein SAMN04487897_1221 [Paenibacillus sp. yr247]|nr:hypothetical protein SAMN04487897_1221 [Paenibacillus sp. yr247]
MTIYSNINASILIDRNLFQSCFRVRCKTPLFVYRIRLVVGAEGVAGTVEVAVVTEAEGAGETFTCDAG